jgi:hypothetical protein
LSAIADVDGPFGVREEPTVERLLVLLKPRERDRERERLRRRTFWKNSGNGSNCLKRFHMNRDGLSICD